jgi:hypothetical protein
MGGYCNEHLAEAGLLESVHGTVLVAVGHDEPEGGVDVGADVVSPAPDKAVDDVPARLGGRQVRALADLWPVLEVDHGLEERAHKLTELQRRRGVARAVGILGIHQIRTRQQRSIDVATEALRLPVVVVSHVLHVRHCLLFLRCYLSLIVTLVNCDRRSLVLSIRDIAAD